MKGKEVNLFYVRKERNSLTDDNEIENGKEEFEIVSHYCVITSLSRLLSSTVRKDDKGKVYICRKCCNSFKSQKDLDKHAPCMSTTFDRYPGPGTLLQFNNFKNTTKVPFTFIFDFERFLKPIDESE